MIRALVTLMLLAATPAIAGSSLHLTPDGHTYHHIEVAGAKRVGLAMRWANPIADPVIGKAVTSIVAGNAIVRGPAVGRQAADIVEDLADLDAALNFNVKLDAVSLFMTASQQSLGDVAEIATDLVATPSLEARWIDRERRRIVDQTIALSDRTAFAARQILTQLTVRDARRRAFLTPRPELLRAVSDDDVRAWHARMLSGGVVTIATAGPVDHATTALVIDRVLQAIPASAGKPAAPGDNEIDLGPRATILRIANPNGSYVTFAGLLPGPRADEPAAEIAVDLLGDGTGSRLFRDVRLGARASYNMRTAGFDILPGRKAFTLEGDLATATFARGLDAIRTSYERWRLGRFSAAEIALARRVHVDHVRQPFAEPARAAVNLADRVARAGARKAFEENDLRPDLSAVSDEAVREAARRFPPFDELIRVILTRDVETALSKFPDACVIERVDRARGCVEE